MLTSLLLVALQAPAPPDPAQVSSERLRATLHELCRKPRLAGSAAAQDAAEYAARVLAEAGLRVERPRYRVHLPRQSGQSLVLLEADGGRRELDLHERGYAEDPASLRDHVPPMLGLAAPGSVAGRVVFAGHGTPEEFAALRDLLGPELQGSVALIRYGGLYRGRKVQNAADAGCAGALLYCDAQDDGSARGAVLPAGPFRPDSGIQRGSVYNADGDPITPGWAAVEGAPRVPLDEATGLVPIPCLPLSWGNAQLLFGPEGRPAQPGALAARVELKVEQDPEPVFIENVLGVLEGSARPDEWIILGAHRDSWGPGASDNGGGTAVVLEVARLLGRAAERGWRPQRTVLLATWDGEEWGLVGSTEWVEQHRQALLGRGLAYLNLDTVASGPRFGAFSTPGLVQALLRACEQEGVAAPEALGVPGGGSDHVPFLELAGMEVLGFGFHGSHGTYHSALDTPFVVERHLDPDFSLHARTARMALRLVLDLAAADTRVDGLASWASQTVEAARQLELHAELGQELRAAAAELATAVQARGSSAPHPHRFLRFFLHTEEPTRGLLWRSSGYGSHWFPEIVEALHAGLDPEPAVQRASRALRLAAQGIESRGEGLGR